MFGRRRIRQLEAEIAVLNAALDFYAVNDNWRRRAKYSKGRHWEMCAASKDHGARAREALLKAKAIRRSPVAKLAHELRVLWQSIRSEFETRRSIANAADHMKRVVHVPAPLTPMPDSRPTGETA